MKDSKNNKTNSEAISDVSVRVYGDVAIARVKLRFKVVAHGQTIRHEGWTTDQFQRRNGHWKLVWSQSTAIPDHLDLFILSLQP
jgi:ketosteroid isomerase-like protein